MRRLKPSERAVSARVPQRHAGGPLEASEGVRVDEQAAGQEVSGRRSVDSGLSGERQDRLAPIVEDAAQRPGGTNELSDTGRGVLAELSGQELTDDVVARSSWSSGPARHAQPSHQITGHSQAIPVANKRSTRQTGVSKPQSGRETFEMAVHKEAGSRVHLLIATAVGRSGNLDMVALTKAMWNLSPVGGTIRSGVRVSCASKASMYLSRICPGPGWKLVGAEVPVRRGVADLVWRHTASGDVFIEEIKSGAARIGDAKVTDQVTRLHAGGVDEWASSFIGVRLVALTAPALTALYVLKSNRLVPVADARLVVR